jgi:hypothetical protein
MQLSKSANFAASGHQLIVLHAEKEESSKVSIMAAMDCQHRELSLK